MAYSIEFKGDVRNVMGELTKVQQKANSISSKPLTNTNPKISQVPNIQLPKAQSLDIKAMGLDAVSSKLGGITAQFGALGKAIPTALNPISISIGAMAATVAYSINHLKQTIADTVPHASNFEQYETIFIPILGSAEKAKNRIEELVNFASSTPFQIEGISKASKVLETLTAGALSTGNGLRMVGDMASVANVPLEEISSTVGRLYSNVQGGNSSGEELRRLQELGLLSTETKNRVLELQKAGAEGSEVWGVLANEFKKVDGAMAELSTTHKGLQSTLEDNINIGKAKAGEPYLKAEKAIIAGQIEQQKIKNRLIEEEADLTAVSAQQWRQAGQAMNDVGIYTDLVAKDVGSLFDGLGAVASKIGADLLKGSLSVLTLGYSDKYVEQQKAMEKSITEGEKLKANYEAKVKAREAKVKLAHEAEIKRIEDLKEGYKKLGEEIDKTLGDVDKKINDDKKSYTNKDANLKNILAETNLSNLFANGFESATSKEVDKAIGTIRMKLQELKETQSFSPGSFSEDDKKSLYLQVELIEKLMVKKKELFDLEAKKVKDDFEVKKIQDELNLLEKKNELLRLQNKTKLSAKENLEKSNLEDAISAQEKLTSIQEYKLSLIEKYNLKEAEALAIAERKYKLENDNKNLESIKNKNKNNNKNNANNEQKVVTNILDKLRDMTVSSEGKHGNGFGGIPQLDVANNIMRNLQTRQLTVQEQQLATLQSIHRDMKSTNSATFA